MLAAAVDQAWPRPRVEEAEERTRCRPGGSAAAGGRGRPPSAATVPGPETRAPADPPIGPPRPDLDRFPLRCRPVPSSPSGSPVQGSFPGLGPWRGHLPGSARRGNEHVFDKMGPCRRPAPPPSCTPISTPSTRPSSSSSIPRCRAGPSPLAEAWSSPLHTRREAHGVRAWDARAGGPGNSARALQFVGGHFHEYQRLADRGQSAVFSDFTPLVERVSIDEAFLDVGRRRPPLRGAPGRSPSPSAPGCAAEIGLPFSVGVARTKHLAKVASQVAKPDGLVVVEPDRRAGVPRPAAGRADLGRGPEPPEDSWPV